jgi:acyl-CoA synthetase (AMP-forming)/AMP-acid ligase II
MVLKSDVHDRSGRLILGSDVELTVKHLRMLRMWGIAEANIVGVDDQADGAPPVADVDPASLAVMENKLRLLFRNADLSYPATGELFRLCLLRKVRNESR